MASAHVVSVNVGTPRTVPDGDREVITAIWKAAVAGRVAIRGVNVEGDDQADRRVHGGPDQALYAYAAEDLAWWSHALSREVRPGTVGENLTVSGIDPAASVVGERWRVGTALLRVTQPRTPCHKLGLRMGDRRFPARFAEAGRPGAYLAILEEGDVGAGDAVEVVDVPDHGLTVGDVERAYHADRSIAGRMVDNPDLSATWRDWAAKALAARG